MIELLQEIEASRGVPVELLCAALEEALPTAYRQFAGDVDAIAIVDRQTGAIALHRRRVVVDALADPHREILRTEAPAGYEPGDYVDEPIAIGDFARLAALTAKRVFAQRAIEFERERVFATYRERQGTIVHGLVQREIHGSIYVVFEDGQEAVLPRSERAPHDAFAINDMLEAELFGVYRTNRGPALLLSRSRASFVRAMFDCPEILAAARRPGYVTVLATTKPLDPRTIADVRAALDSERIDVVRWSHDPAEIVAQLMPPGSGEIFALEEHRIVFVEANEVTALQLDLATQLCGWDVVPCEPGKSDVALEAHLAAIAAAAPAPSDVAIDPDLVRKLEAFAREREEGEDADDGVS